MVSKAMVKTVAFPKRWTALIDKVGPKNRHMNRRFVLGLLLFKTPSSKTRYVAKRCKVSKKHR